MPAKLQTVNRFLKAIGEASRLKILLFLLDSPRCVCEIYPMLHVSQKLASHHLAQLKKADLVVTERRGNFIYYGLDRKALNENLRNINSMMGYDKTGRD